MLAFLFLLLSAILSSCGTSSEIAGGSTTVESPYVICTVYDTNERQIKDAKVTLYPYTYNPTASLNDSIYAGFTDSDGVVGFENIPNGAYTVIVDADSLNCIVYPVRISSDTSSRKITSTVTKGSKAQLYTGEENSRVYFKGTPYVGIYNSEESAYFFPDLPVGAYPPLNIEGDSGTVVAKELSILPDIVNKFYLDSIVIIDGTSLELSYIQPNYSDSISSPITAIGSIRGKNWYGSESGGVLFRYNEYFFSRIYSSQEDHVLSAPIEEIATCSDWKCGVDKERLLIRSANGTFFYSDHYVEVLENLLHDYIDEPHAKAIHVDPSGKCWAAYNNMIFSTDPESDQWIFHMYASGANSFAGDYRKKLYIGKDDGTVTVLENGGFSKILITADPFEKINSLGLSQNDELYVATSKGLYVVQNNIVQLLTENGHGYGKIRIDAKGVVYSLTGKNSIVTINQGIASVYENIGGENLTIYDFTCTNEGELICAGGKDGIVRFTAN